MTSLVLFDGVCNLCNGFVQFVIRRDQAGRFLFASLQSESARRALLYVKVSRRLLDSLVLIEDGRVFTRSSAVLRVARGLRFPWPLASTLVVIPRPVRDWGYDLVARNRYGWFGRRDACMVPTPELRARFLSD